MQLNVSNQLTRFNSSIETFRLKVKQDQGMKIITVFTICILIEISYQTTVTSQPESDFLNKNATAVLNEAANSINCLTTEHFRETLSAEAKSRDDLCKATTDKSSSSITAQSSSEVKRDEGFVPSVPLYGEDGGVASSDDMHIANEKILQEDTTAVGETSEDATGEITEHTETIEMIDVTTTDATTVEDTTTEATTEASTTEASTTEATTTEATTTEDTTVEDTTEETTVAVPGEFELSQQSLQAITKIHSKHSLTPILTVGICKLDSFDSSNSLVTTTTDQTKRRGLIKFILHRT